MFAARDLSPFLKAGMTFAFNQSAGSLPVWRDLSNMILMIGVISSRSSLSRRGLSLSGPAALLGLRFFKSFNSPFCEMLISGIVVAESCDVSGMVSEGSLPALFKSSTHRYKGLVLVL